MNNYLKDIDDVLNEGKIKNKFKKVNMTLFNKYVKGELRTWKLEYPTIAERNEIIARKFLFMLAEINNLEIQDVEFANADKKPDKYFQMRIYCNKGIIIYSCFVVVVKNSVDIKESLVEILDYDYELIERIYSGPDYMN